MKADLSSSSSNLTEMLQAISQNDLRIFTASVASYRGDIPNGAMDAAAFYGREKMMQILRVAGLDPHARDDQALCYAAAGGKTHVMQSLLDDGADARTQNDRPLCSAADKDHDEVVALLAQHIFAPEAWVGKTAADVRQSIDQIAQALADYQNSVESNIPARQQTKALEVIEAQAGMLSTLLGPARPNASAAASLPVAQPA